MSLVARVQDLTDSFSRKLAFLPPAVARFALGLVFLKSGWGKLHGLDQVTQFFTDLGIPAPALQAAFVSGVELVGGALLLAGLLTRVAAVPLAVTMVVAILTAQRSEIHDLGDLAGLLELAYLSMLTWLAVGGPGALSLDAVLGRLLRARRPAASSAVAHSAVRSA